MTSTTTPVIPTGTPPRVHDLATRILVLSTIALAGFDLRLIGGLPAVLVVLGATLPLWWRIVVETEFLPWILTLAGIAVVAGLVLAESTSSDHAINSAGQRAVILHFAAGLGLVVALLWGRSVAPLHVVAATYGGGALIDALLNSPRSWKYDLALPVTIIVVGWAGRYRSRVPGVVALVVLGTMSALDQGRSFFALCILAAALAAWQLRPTAGSGSTSRWYPLVLLAGVGAATYALATNLLLAGYFGTDAQQRTLFQIERSGSLISGGRPEWAASVALFRERPLGYGIGVVPDTRDYSVAKSGFDSINVNADGYLQNFMLDGGFRLHSVAADLWAGFGVVGVALTVLIAFALARTLSSLAAVRRCPPIVTLAVVLAMWNLLFGPFYTNWPDVCFALGITLLPRDTLAAAFADRRPAPVTDEAGHRS